MKCSRPGLSPSMGRQFELAAVGCQYSSAQINQVIPTVS